jgi:hypothetical protein
MFNHPFSFAFKINLPRVVYHAFTLTHLSTASTSSFYTCFKSNFHLQHVTGIVRFIEMERCKNPWKTTCKSGNIQLYIQFKGEKLPICRKCWSNLADKEVSWGD